jgi:hypothetical protein
MRLVILSGGESLVLDHILGKQKDMGVLCLILKMKAITKFLLSMKIAGRGRSLLRRFNLECRCGDETLEFLINRSKSFWKRNSCYFRMVAHEKNAQRTQELS